MILCPDSAILHLRSPLKPVPPNQRDLVGWQQLKDNIKLVPEMKNTCCTKLLNDYSFYGLLISKIRLRKLIFYPRENLNQTWNKRLTVDASLHVSAT